MRPETPASPQLDGERSSVQPEVKPDCLGTLCTESSAKGTELPAALEPIFEQPAHLRVASVCAVGDGGIESVGRRKGCILRSILAYCGTNTA